LGSLSGLGGECAAVPEDKAPALEEPQA